MIHTIKVINKLSAGEREAGFTDSFNSGVVVMERKKTELQAKHPSAVQVHSDFEWTDDGRIIRTAQFRIGQS